MTEVYIEHFVRPCPTDGIIAPHVRRMMLESVEQDVEVVDGFRLFRSLRDVDSECLYNTCNAHWAPRASGIWRRLLRIGLSGMTSARGREVQCRWRGLASKDISLKEFQAGSETKPAGPPCRRG